MADMRKNKVIKGLKESKATIGELVLEAITKQDKTSVELLSNAMTSIDLAIEKIRKSK